MANIKSEDYGLTPLLLGNNEFETAKISASSSDVRRGEIVTRGTDGTFANGPIVGVSYGKGFAIAVEDAKAGEAVRVCIAGKVNRNVINIGGVAVGNPECDLLRSQCIIAIKVNEV